MFVLIYTLRRCDVSHRLWRRRVGSSVGSRLHRLTRLDVSVPRYSLHTILTTHHTHYTPYALHTIRTTHHTHYVPYSPYSSGYDAPAEHYTAATKYIDYLSQYVTKATCGLLTTAYPVTHYGTLHHSLYPHSTTHLLVICR
jgi:hypothetical protein